VLGNWQEVNGSKKVENPYFSRYADMLKMRSACFKTACFQTGTLFWQDDYRYCFDWPGKSPLLSGKMIPDRKNSQKSYLNVETTRIFPFPLGPKTMVFLACYFAFGENSRTLLLDIIRTHLPRLIPDAFPIW